MSYDYLPWLDDDDYDHDGYDMEDEWEFDCHMDRNGQCGMAGSEECDFECPTMADIHRREAQARLAKKKKANAD